MSAIDGFIHSDSSALMPNPIIVHHSLTTSKMSPSAGDKVKMENFAFKKRSTNVAGKGAPPPAKKQKRIEHNYRPKENLVAQAVANPQITSTSNESTASTSRGKMNMIDASIWENSRKQEAEANGEADREGTTPLKPMTPRQVVEQFEKQLIDLNEADCYIIAHRDLETFMAIHTVTRSFASFSSAAHLEWLLGIQRLSDLSEG
ncbi:hypothetical protein BKA65DRAFT_485658 [Rhexocercosporidium sp. MPI-PUGE-AT-0058]|nr:hypothetical protein BKA65DRAFT_485658 [Rhexocercosporidium sp. MPI-PUGE-AT-0058]